MTAATAAEAPGTLSPTARWAAAWRGSLHGRTLDPRNNSLNLVRLVLAASVLVAHGYYITGNGIGPHLDGENIGGWAVFGFFTISGYLIAGSRFSNSLGTYLIHRLARLLPAFWVCLVVTALVFAPIGYWASNRTLDGFLTTPTTPFSYVWVNAFLKINAYDVAGTPAGVPYAGAWNGSLWSLYYEFLCYLIIGALGLAAVVRRRPGVLVAVWAVSVVAWWRIADLQPYLGNNTDLQLLGKLLPLFLGGAVVYVLKDRLPLHWVGALASVAAVAAAVGLLDRWGAQLTAPFITYAILWFASVVPSPRLIQRHDISYGVYIYAFPVQQLAAYAGVQEYGMWTHNLVSALGTVPLAIASWLLVERPVMRRARRRTAAPGGPVPVTTTATQQVPVVGVPGSASR